VEGERVVGMVTLDDLLLDEAAPIEELAAIVEAQIGAGGMPDTARTPARRRSLTRAEATLRQFVTRSRARAGRETAEQARTAADVVLSFLVRRLTPEEARDLIDQLPSLLQPQLRGLPPGPDKSIDRAAVEAELAKRMNTDTARAATLLVDVAGAIAASISRG